MFCVRFVDVNSRENPAMRDLGEERAEFERGGQVVLRALHDVERDTDPSVGVA